MHLQRKKYNLVEMITQEPPKPEYIIHGFERGTVGIIAGAGGVGKSMYAIQLAFAVASGGKYNLLDFKVPKQRKVVYVSAEDTLSMIHERVHVIAEKMEIAEDDAQKLSENLIIIDPFEGEESLTLEAFLETTKNEFKDIDLVIIDTFSHFLNGQDENSNSDMKVVMTSLQRVAKRTDTAILLLHHASKASVKDINGFGQQAVRGASAIVDHARYVVAMRRMTYEEGLLYYDPDISSQKPISYLMPPQRYKNYVYAEVTKQNRGNIEPGKWYVFKKGGVLIPASIKGTASLQQKFQQEQEEKQGVKRCEV